MTLNITEYTQNYNTNTFECPVCPLPMDTITGLRAFVLLSIVAVALWYFHLFVLPRLLYASDYTKIQRLIIQKTSLAITFLIMALALNFSFYL